MKYSDGFSINTLARKRRYQQILDALGGAEDTDTDTDTAYPQLNVAEVAERAEKMRQGLNAYHRSRGHGAGMDEESVIRDIQEPHDQLRTAALRLGTDERPFLRALGHGMMLFLHLSWSTTTADVLAERAQQLREALESSHLKLCSTKNLTTWLFLVGGIASEPSSERRGWFVRRLGSMLVTIPIVNWAEMVGNLEQTYMPDEKLLRQFKMIWEECGVSVNGHSEAQRQAMTRIRNV